VLAGVCARDVVIGLLEVDAGIRYSKARGQKNPNRRAARLTNYARGSIGK